MFRGEIKWIFNCLSDRLNWPVKSENLYVDIASGKERDKLRRLKNTEKNFGRKWLKRDGHV